MIAGVDWVQTSGMANGTRVIHGAPTSVHRPTYAIPRAQPAHHLCGAPALSFLQRREGVEALPYEVSASHLRCTNPSVTALYAVTAPLAGEPRGVG